MIEFNLKEIILYEDDHLIVLNKPAGLLSIEDGYDKNKINLRSILREVYGKIWVVHRLDKNTSGVIVYAKNENSHRKLNDTFASHANIKNYRGIINGIPIWNSYEITLPLKINGDKKHRTIIDLSDGKPALTSITKLNTQDLYSYLDIFPHTGFTHQIRSHLSAIGFPILGDDLYWRCCKLKKNYGLTQNLFFEGYFLHAYSLKFIHPASNELMNVTAPIPISFIDMLSTLKLSLNC
jgi:tRNA pseudouridine32 synthase/23S rRNA pseudouridine746 synthase